ncbi:hypothetical protein ABW20_dc0108412 [Dactylellina cionopaga]|nr:hypothetical protein ABW20_dc0108412 [Dactylellina cionopaga]
MDLKAIVSAEQKKRKQKTTSSYQSVGEASAYQREPSKSFDIFSNYGGADNHVPDSPSLSDTNSICSSISDVDEFDPAPIILNATAYICHHMQPRFFCDKEPLSMDAVSPDLRLYEKDLKRLARDGSWPSWKIDSVKRGGDLIKFGANDASPLSSLDQQPRQPHDEHPKILQLPRYLHIESLDWKFASDTYKAFVLLEMVSNRPPECAIWEDKENGFCLNSTKWLSADRRGKSLYVYNVPKSIDGRYWEVWPNRLNEDSKRCATEIIAVLKPSVSRMPFRSLKASKPCCGHSRPACDGADGGADYYDEMEVNFPIIPKNLKRKAFSMGFAEGPLVKRNRRFGPPTQQKMPGLLSTVPSLDIPSTSKTKSRAKSAPAPLWECEYCKYKYGHCYVARDRMQCPAPGSSKQEGNWNGEPMGRWPKEPVKKAPPRPIFWNTTEKDSKGNEEFNTSSGTYLLKLKGKEPIIQESTVTTGNFGAVPCKRIMLDTEYDPEGDYETNTVPQTYLLRSEELKPIVEESLITIERAKGESEKVEEDYDDKMDIDSGYCSNDSLLDSQSMDTDSEGDHRSSRDILPNTETVYLNDSTDDEMIDEIDEETDDEADYLTDDEMDYVMDSDVIQEARAVGSDAEHLDTDMAGMDDDLDSLSDYTDTSSCARRVFHCDGASDESQWPAWLLKHRDWSEEDAMKLPVFDRSDGEGIRVIYVTRDPKTGEPAPLVDYVREEDERYLFVQETIERGRESGSTADSLTVDCPQLSQKELRERLHLAYDNLRERLAFIAREGGGGGKGPKSRISPPPKDPKMKLATLVVGPSGPIPLDGAGDDEATSNFGGDEVPDLGSLPGCLLDTPVPYINYGTLAPG